MVTVNYVDARTEVLEQHYHEDGTAFTVDDGTLYISSDSGEIAVYAFGNWHSAEVTTDDND